MRYDGWGVVNIGPLTEKAIERFMVKLGMALYYKHNGALFDGVIYADHVNFLAIDKPSDVLNKMLRMAPHLSTPQRANTLLIDRFIYRFQHSPEQGLMYAIVQFNEQFIFQLIVIDHKMADELEAMSRRDGSDLPSVRRYLCPLKHRPVAE